MKKVTAFVGSARKKNTYKTVVQFLDNLKALGDVEVEIVTLNDYQLGICRGCQLCFNKGEAFCPLKDDRDVLFEKINTSDGVIFATPNYVWDMSGVMKVFLERFGFASHRPRYFGKVFTSIVTQGIGRGNKIVETLDFAASILGFTTLKGMTITAFDERTEKQQQKIDRAIEKQSKRFYTVLEQPAFPVPSLFRLMLFRFNRTMVNRKADPGTVDYRYFADKGWFDSDFYYPTRLGGMKQVIGRLIDAAVARM